jgi:hypothetical protein
MPASITRVVSAGTLMSLLALTCSGQAVRKTPSAQTPVRPTLRKIPIIACVQFHSRGCPTFKELLEKKDDNIELPVESGSEAEACFVPRKDVFYLLFFDTWARSDALSVRRFEHGLTTTEIIGSLRDTSLPADLAVIPPLNSRGITLGGNLTASTLDMIDSFRNDAGDNVTWNIKLSRTILRFRSTFEIDGRTTLAESGECAKYTWSDSHGLRETIVAKR